MGLRGLWHGIGRAGCMAGAALLLAASGGSPAPVPATTVRDGAVWDGVSPLRVGVAYLPPPYTPSDVRLYTEEGFDIDLARDLGSRLGVPVELVRVDDARRVEALRSGAVHLVVGRAGADDPLRSAAAVTPAGFGSGASVSMRTDTTIRRWDDLAGRTVCVSEAGTAARALAEAHGAAVRVERAPARALMQVRTGDCDAAIHDQAVLDELFRRPEWRKFSATLPAVRPTDLVVAHAPHDGTLGARIGAALADIGSERAWAGRRQRWAANVAFEVYLDQEAPDCH